MEKLPLTVIVCLYPNMKILLKELPKITFVTDVDYIGKIWSARR